MNNKIDKLNKNFFLSTDILDFIFCSSFEFYFVLINIAADILQRDRILMVRMNKICIF